MHFKVRLSPLALAVSATLSSQAMAITELNLDKTDIQTVKNSFQIQSPGNKGKQNLNLGDSLIFLRDHQDQNGVTHARYVQSYAGITVFGGYAIFHGKSNPNNLLTQSHALTMNGNLYQGLAAELGKPSEAFKKNGSKALASLKSSYSEGTLSEETLKPLVYIDEHQKPHWAYQVSVLVSYPDKIPARPTWIVDAESLKPYLKWNEVKTLRSRVEGMGFSGNVKLGLHQYGKDLPMLELSKDANGKECYMENEIVRVVDMNHGYKSNNQAMKFPCAADPKLGGNWVWTGYKGDGYDLTNEGYSPSNDALYIGMVVSKLYQDWYHLSVLKNEDNSPMQMIMRVHYGYRVEDTNNASWDGKRMNFGDGGDDFYPMVSLGVGAHEVSHGFTEQHSGLMYFGQSGGMNESFSDMAAQAAEYYLTGSNLWTIGSEITKASFKMEALRYMDMPSRDNYSIDSADQYYPSMDPHLSSGVYNRFFYLLANQPGWDTHKAFDVMVKANMDYWTPYTKYRDGACGVLNAATDLNRPIGDVKKALDGVKIKYNDCLLKIANQD